MIELQLNIVTRFDQEHPTTAALVGGGFVTVWQDGYKEGLTNDGIYGTVVTASGVVRQEFRIPASTIDDQELPIVAALPNGGFVVGWHTGDADDNGVDDPYDTPYARFFDEDANPVTGNIQLAPSLSSGITPPGGIPRQVR